MPSDEKTGTTPNSCPERTRRRYGADMEQPFVTKARQSCKHRLTFRQQLTGQSCRYVKGSLFLWFKSRLTKTGGYNTLPLSGMTCILHYPPFMGRRYSCDFALSSKTHKTII